MRRCWLTVICAALGVLTAAAPVRAAFDDPLFVFTPAPGQSSLPSPAGYFDGPCGLAVDSAGRFYVADYYHQVVDVYSGSAGYAGTTKNGATGYLGQLSGVGVDPLDGPCGVALDSSDKLYVNDYHRAVLAYGAYPSFGTGTAIAGAGVDDSDPTGVAVDSATDHVYVDERTSVEEYDSTGTPVQQIGTTLGDGYGIAVSGFAGSASFPTPTAGFIYVPDAATQTVMVYDPAVDTGNPVAQINGPPGGFADLQDSAVAIDDRTGEVYVIDTLGPQYSESPQAAVYVFHPDGSYEGRLKYNVVNGGPSGLAVDNSTSGKPGRVYVTSGISVQASVYAYPPGAATSAALPPFFSLALASTGSGGGTVSAVGPAFECSSSCSRAVRSGAQVTLAARPDPGSSFAGWSGAGCEGTGDCTVTMDQARSLSADFESSAGPPAPTMPAAPRPALDVTQEGTLRVAVLGKLRPQLLPRSGSAPISVTVSGRISTTDHSLPPLLKTMRIDLNRHGRIDYAGLPDCDVHRIQPGSSAHALSACRRSLVGSGQFTVDLTLAGQNPYPAKGKLFVFKGTRHGKPVLYGHLYSPRPFATSFVIPFAITTLRDGAYGTRLSAPLPKAMKSWGRLTGIRMTLARRYRAGGARRSFLSSGCPAPGGILASFHLARAFFEFAGGKQVTSKVSDACRGRR